MDLGLWKWFAVAFIVGDHFINFFTFVIMIGGSFMTRVGYFMIDPVFSLRHWEFVLSEPHFYTGLKTTVIIASAAGVGSPLLFATLAYIIVRSRWRFRLALDTLVWVGGAIPGILSGLGLLLMFLWTPGLSFLYGTIWVLILVVVIQGNTTGINVFKGNIVPDRLRHGGGRADIGSRVVQDIRSNLVAATRALLGANRVAELQYRRQYNSGRNLACFTRNGNGFCN